MSRQHFHFKTIPKTKCKVVPVHGVMRVFEPEVHYVVQFFADLFPPLRQLHHRHCSLQKEHKNQFVIKGKTFALLIRIDLTEHVLKVSW